MTDTLEMTDAEISGLLSEDLEAPYGRFKNGKPRKSPAGQAPAGDIPTVPGPRKRTPKAPAPKKGSPDYAQLSENVVQLPIMALSLAGQILSSVGRPEIGTPLALDGMTLGLYSKQLGDVGRRMAEADGRIARWLERFGKGGPLGEALTLGGMIAAQFAVNHGRMQAMPAAGLLTPQEIYDRAQAMVGAKPEPADAVPVG